MMPMCRVADDDDDGRRRKKCDRKLVCSALLFHGMYWGQAWRRWAEFLTGNPGIRSRTAYCYTTRVGVHGKWLGWIVLFAVACFPYLEIGLNLSWYRKWLVELFWWQQYEHFLEAGLHSVAFLSSHTKMELMIISWLAAVICSRRMRRWNLGPCTLRCFFQFGLPCRYLSTRAPSPIQWLTQ